VCERNLPDGSCGLAFFEFERASGKPEFAPPERNGARGHQHYLLLACTQTEQVLDQGFEPWPIDLSRGLIHQQRGADLDDDSACTS
jgi:hypothetical protein